tara:strand:- start:794 stop:1069 length:276 start_codon:yes stop_codon:yes gene_type:complete
MSEETKQTTYTPAVKKAIMKHRAKNIDKYNEFQRGYYHQQKEDPEWYLKFCIRCKEANKRYRDKKKAEAGEDVRPRGRPRKIIIKESLDAI